MSRPLYQALDSILVAIGNCEEMGKLERRGNHLTVLEQLVKDRMPSGSGFDSGTELDMDKSRRDRLVFNTAFHHMDGHGYYSGWTEHSVIVTPSLSDGFDLRVTGRDRNEIKDYIGEEFYHALNERVETAPYYSKLGQS